MQKIFKHSNTFIILILAISLGFLTLAYSEIGFSARWQIWLMWALGIGCLLLTVDMKISYLKLTNEALVYHSDFKSKSFQKKLIKKVTWQKGCGVSLQMNDDKWVEVPSFSQNAQSMSNSIRAWLKKS